ncbi:MAG TPA: polysaccharide deacetylase family protein [Ktedonobacteraceae bacterium]|nr:polysaccharide deacetylase family protein [Ktedonobacteraceae bacterium]
MANQKASISRIAIQAGAVVAETGEKILQRFSITLPWWLNKTAHIPILMYHSISIHPGNEEREALAVTPEMFEAQMAYLARHSYTPITLERVYSYFAGQATLPAKPIVLTFDDGYVDFYFNAYPILQKYGFHAVCFIITGAVGQEEYLSWDQIREMQSSGLVSFEAHTVTHPNLPKLSSIRLLSELADSKYILQAQTGRTSNFIAYPYGRTNLAVKQAAQQAGFLGGVGVWYGKASHAGMNMPRIQVDRQMSLQTFAARL